MNDKTWWDKRKEGRKEGIRTKKYINQENCNTCTAVFGLYTIRCLGLVFCCSTIEEHV
jgi:hypothetical protein